MSRERSTRSTIKRAIRSSKRRHAFLQKRIRSRVAKGLDADKDMAEASSLHTLIDVAEVFLELDAAQEDTDDVAVPEEEPAED